MEMEIDSTFMNINNVDLPTAIELLNQEISKLNSALSTATSPEDYQALLNARQAAQKAIDNSNYHEIEKSIKNLKSINL